jgi:hypothetical protein
MRLARTAASSLLALLLLTPAPALACFDGYTASVGRVSVTVSGGPEWSRAFARDVASWLTRVDALLSAGDGATALFGDVTVTHAGIDRDARWRDDELPHLFDAVARLTRPSPAVRRAAVSHVVVPRTMQTFASHDPAAAVRFARSINDRQLGEEGFLSVGGFPALHDTAHVVDAVDAAGRPLFRVFVGAFLDGTSAQRAALSLAHDAGVHGFVRAL